MVMPARLLAAAFALSLLGACAADLADAVYACADGNCPPGFECRGDDLCHAPSALTSTDGTPCRTDRECTSGICQKFPDPQQTHGTCAPAISCTSDGQCGTNQLCLPNMRCGVLCDTDSDCPVDAGYGCIQVPGPTNVKACLRLDAGSRYDGLEVCAPSSNTCAMPLACFAMTSLDANIGICSWPCSPTASCPTNSLCMNVIPGGGGMQQPTCLHPCTTQADCGNSATPLRCLAATDAQYGSFCVPQGFAGHF